MQSILKFIGSCQSWTRTLSFYVLKLWPVSWPDGAAGQMEPLGRELFRATPHCWPNWLKSWTGGVDLRALLGRAGFPFPQLAMPTFPKAKNPKDLKNSKGILEAVPLWPEYEERRMGTISVSRVLQKSVYVAAGLSFSSMTKPVVF